MRYLTAALGILTAFATVQPAAANNYEMAVWSATNQFCSLVSSGGIRQLGEYGAIERSVDHAMKVWGTRIGADRYQLRNAVLDQTRAQGCR